MAMARGGLPGGFFGPHTVHAAVGRGAPRRHRGRLHLPRRRLAIGAAEARGGGAGFGGVALRRGLLPRRDSCGEGAQKWPNITSWKLGNGKSCTKRWVNMTFLVFVGVQYLL